MLVDGAKESLVRQELICSKSAEVSILESHVECDVSTTAKRLQEAEVKMDTLTQGNRELEERCVELYNEVVNERSRREDATRLDIEVEIETLRTENEGLASYIDHLM